MSEHPQVVAFRQAAGLLRDQRYWRRSDDDEIDFLRALADVVREVSFHLDAVEALDLEWLREYCRTAGLRSLSGRANAELVLMAAVDAVLERRLATASAARNTEDSTGK